MEYVICKQSKSQRVSDANRLVHLTNDPFVISMSELYLPAGHWGAGYTNIDYIPKLTIPIQECYNNISYPVRSLDLCIYDKYGIL